MDPTLAIDDFLEDDLGRWDTQEDIAVDSSFDLVVEEEEDGDPLPAPLCIWYEMEPEERKALALDRIDEIFGRVLDDGETSLEYPTLGDWANVEYSVELGLQPVEDSEVFLSRIYGPTLVKFLHVLDVMRTLLETNTRTTKRDIYYQHVTRFSCQKEVDRLVNIAVAMLEVPRLYLGVVATSKGLVVGNFQFTNEDGVIVDCSLALGGESIPQNIPDLDSVVDPGVEFLLVVEKDAVFQRLLEEDVFGQELLARAVLVTGKGMPDIATRQLVTHLAGRGLQVLVLTDCDPYGLEIFMTYKFGSLSSCWSQEPLAAPSSLWLGVHPQDMLDLGFPRTRLRPHSVADKKRILDFNRRVYVQADPQLRQSIDLMWNLGGKTEIQQVFEEREPGFLVESYLPMKMAQLGFGELV